MHYHKLEQSSCARFRLPGPAGDRSTHHTCDPCGPAKRWQPDRRFADRISGQRRQRQIRRRIKDRERYCRAKRNHELIATLAREAEHRGKYLLGSVLATINLSQSDSIEDLKQTIVGLASERL